MATGDGYRFSLHVKKPVHAILLIFKQVKQQYNLQYFSYDYNHYHYHYINKFWQVRNLWLPFHLFVCLFVILQKNALKEVHEIRRIHTRNNLENFGYGMLKPLHTGFLFIFFQWNPCLWAILRKNVRINFHKIFKKVWTWDKEQSGTFSGSCS